MLSKLRSRLSTAHLIALVALFFAIGGPSFAANAVSSAAKLITGKQIKDSSVTTKDIKNGSLLSADFKPGQLPSATQGPKGDNGQQGPKGDAGAPGQDGTSVTSASEPSGANCPNGGSKFTAANGDAYACNGAKGDTGDPGLSGYEWVMGAASTYDANTKSVHVACTAGKKVLSAGINSTYLMDGSGKPPVTGVVGLDGDREGVTVTAVKPDTADNFAFTPYAVCAAVAP